MTKMIKLDVHQLITLEIAFEEFIRDQVKTLEEIKAGLLNDMALEPKKNIQANIEYLIDNAKKILSQTKEGK
jgi:hypothetical protein